MVSSNFSYCSYDSGLKEKIKTFATKENIKSLGAKPTLKSGQTFILGCFHGRSYFEGHETQNYLVLQALYRLFKKISNNGRISACNSKGLSDESIKSANTSNNNLQL